MEHLKDIHVSTPVTGLNRYLVQVFHIEQKVMILHCFCPQNVITSNAYYQVNVESNSTDKTYTATTLSIEEIVEGHKSVLSSFGLY